MPISMEHMHNFLHELPYKDLFCYKPGVFVAAGCLGACSSLDTPGVYPIQLLVNSFINIVLVQPILLLHLMMQPSLVAEANLAQHMSDQT